MRARAAVASLGLCALLLAGCSAQADGGPEWLEASDLPYVWEFDQAQDMQNPELPTGCEATALATLMRMSGYPVTKTEVADAMPKSDGDDFVNAFWGDPRSVHGWACMAPCSVSTANGFLGANAAIDLTGTALSDAPTPFAAWVTIDMEEPVRSGYEQDGFSLMRNPHCVVVTAVGDDAVAVVDPLRGCVEYPRMQVEHVYDAMGRQAVCIADRGYAPLN